MTVFGPRAREHEDVRALLNAGHRRGAKAGRCAVKGREIVTEELPAFCAVALAGLGNLPDTILTRSIVIRMRRRSPQEKVTPYRRRIYEQEGHRLRDRLARWTSTITGVLSAASPTMPVEVTDRTADCWESLVTLADAAGGCWPEHARAAAVAFISEARDQSLSIGIRLLADLRTVFGDQQAMLTRAILRALVALDESPWASWKGKELDARALSSMLGRYGIKRFTVRVGNDIGKGYRRPDLHDAWLRYLPSLSPEESDTSGTSGTSRRSNCGNGAACSEAVTDVTDVTDFPGERDTIPF